MTNDAQTDDKVSMSLCSVVIMNTINTTIIISSTNSPILFRNASFATDFTDLLMESTFVVLAICFCMLTIATQIYRQQW